jgi:hypothetical protein
VADFCLWYSEESMNPETRACKNCQAAFDITSDDFSFYEKVKTPPPTFCPECRSQRRFMWRNERTLHKRECDLCKKSLIGLYPPGVPFPVYCYECWYSDQWDALDYATDYDPSRPFLPQLRDLLDRVPHLAVWIVQSTNSQYTNQSYSNKNCYLSFALRDCEDSAYITRVVDLKKSFDCLYTHHSDSVYQSVNVEKSYKSAFVDEAEGAVESMFVSNVRNCQQCIGGVNLRSANNVFFGQQMSKEEYKEQIAQYDMGSRVQIDALQKAFNELKLRSPMKFAKLTNCQNTTGDHVMNARNCTSVFDGFDLENCKYSMWVYTSKEVYDSYGMGGSEFVYETMACEDINNVKFCNGVDTSSYVEYSWFSQSSNNLFGCVGAKSKEYCILNKQYSKEEYEALREQIVEDMKVNPYVSTNGIPYGYGEFFPPEFSPYAYNQTVAQEVFPLTKEQATASGLLWHEEAERNYNITIAAADLPDNIKDVDDSILKEVIGCAHGGKCAEQCATAFRIIDSELAFLRQMNLPLPTLCPNCRHYERLAKRNPLRLWSRECQCAGQGSTNGAYQNSGTHAHGTAPCGESFETSYSPDREEIVYCEKCYQAEVL